MDQVGPGRRWRSWWTTRRAGRRSARPCRSSWRGCTRPGVRAEDVTISVGVGRHHAVDAGRDATAGRRGGRGRVPLLQPAGGRPLGLRRPGPDAPGDSGARLPAGGRGRPADPDRLGAAAPPGGLRRRVQADLARARAIGRRSGPCTARGLGRGGSDAAGLLGGDAADNPMRRAIHAAAGRLGPCWSISHLIGGPGQVFRVIAGHPEQRAGSPRGRGPATLPAPEAAPADVVVAGNHPWPGDPMQSFKVLLHHRAACRPGGVLVGLFWTDPARSAARSRSARCGGSPRRGASGGWAIRRPGAGRPARRRGGRLPGRLHDPMGPRAGRRPHRPGLRPAPARPDRSPPRPDPALRRSGRAVGVCGPVRSSVRGPPGRASTGSGAASRPGLPAGRTHVRTRVGRAHPAPLRRPLGGILLGRTPVWIADRPTRRPADERVAYDRGDEDAVTTRIRHVRGQCGRSKSDAMSRRPADASAPRPG